MAIPLDVEAEVWRRLAQRERPAQIVEALSRDPRFAGREPDLRTIYRRKAQLRAPADADWSLATSPDDGAVLLPILGQLRAANFFSWVDASLARWILAVRRAAPTLDLIDVIAFAGRYRGAEHADDGSVAQVDRALADAVYRAQGGPGRGRRTPD